jgi:hypothetical protein
MQNVNSEVSSSKKFQSNFSITGVRFVLHLLGMQFESVSMSKGRRKLWPSVLFTDKEDLE